MSNRPTEQREPASKSGAIPGTTTAAQSQADWHALDWLHTLYKYRRVAAGVFAVVMLAAAFKTYSATPMYRAQARLLIELEDEQSVAVVGPAATSNAYYRDPDVYYNTQYGILTGRELARRVLDRLSPDQVEAIVSRGATPLTLRSLVARVGTGVRDWMNARLGRDSEPAVVPVPRHDEHALAGLLASRVTVSPVSNSRLVDVGFVSTDPEFAARAVNAVAEEYVVHNLELRRQSVATSLEWIARELERQQEKVESSTRALAQYREDQDALSLSDRQNIVVSRLNQLNDAAIRANTNRVQKEALYDQVRDLTVDAAADGIPPILQNQYIQSIKTDLADLELQRARLLQRYGEKYPSVIEVEASIHDTRAQLQAELQKAVSAIRNDYESAVAEERSLTRSLDEQKQAALDLDRKSAGYTVMERGAESNRRVYETLLQRQSELQVLANSRGNNVKLMDLAVTPGAPFTPNHRRDLSLAFIAGLALVLGLIAGLDYLDDTVKTPEDVTQRLQESFLGIVPKVPTTQHPLLTGKVPHEFGESFRTLRTALVFSAGTSRSRVAMVTSSQPLEGKTTTACNLAISLTLSGARVLLIDADMRRPGVHRALGLDNGPGLSHLLAGQARPRDIVHKMNAPVNLWVLTAGRLPPNPSELLGSDRMRRLIDQVGVFDWVIIDTPPVLAVTDAVVTAPLAGGVVFVIRSEMTQRRLAERALDVLRSGNSHVLGTVLNHVDLARNKYYYSRYYGYKGRAYYPASNPHAA